MSDAEKRPTLDDVLAQIAAAEVAPVAQRLDALHAIKAIHRLGAADQLAALAALTAAKDAFLELARTDAEARGCLLASMNTEAWHWHGRIERLGDFDDDATYRFVREKAVAQLDTEYDSTNPEWLFALGRFATRPPFADDARAIVLGGFAHLVDKVRGTKEHDLVNTVAYGALAYVAAALPHPTTGPILHKAFRISAELEPEIIDPHYELNLTAGPLAVAMSAVDYDGAVSDIEAFLREYEWRYEGDGFVMQCRYALWLLAKDAAGALAHLQEPNNKKNLSLAAAALADLDHKPARAAIADRAATLEHPVAQEAFREALTRLDTQSAPPPVAARMIWMFGRVSSTEQALGADSDNVFVDRAIARTKDSELGTVYEVDDSAPTD